jgi:hypothetical protein
MELEALLIPTRKQLQKEGVNVDQHKAKPNTPQKYKRLSDEEKAKYREKGLCFIYGKEGHQSRNCSQHARNKNKQGFQLRR